MKTQSMVALLNDMRAIAADRPSSPTVDLVDGGKNGSFSEVLGNALAEVNALQGESKRLAAGFERGEPGISLAQVMVASQKSGVAFQAVVEVRNRLVQAYKDVMNMPV